MYIVNAKVARKAEVINSCLKIFSHLLKLQIFKLIENYPNIFQICCLCTKLDIIYFYHFVLTGFFKNNKIHHHCTRNATKFYVISHSLTCRSHSINILGVKLWNNLPTSITESLLLPVFKCRCKHYLGVYNLRTANREPANY